MQIQTIAETQTLQETEGITAPPKAFPGNHPASASPGWSRFLAGRLVRWVGRLDWRGLAAFGLPFLLYLRTLAPTVYNLDSAELTTAAYTGGLVRATGYPLYLTLGALWSRLPLNDVGYRMNLFSAFCGALTVALADRILRRQQVSGWAALGGLGLLAVSPFFWGLSLVAEVYTLHTALMAGLILSLLRWNETPSPLRLAVVGLLGGLSFSHHAATILLLPGSLFYLLSRRGTKASTAASLLAVLSGGLAGLSFMVYLPLRSMAKPLFNYAGVYDANLVFHPVDLATPGGLWWLVSGRAFSGVMMAYSPAELWSEAVHFLAGLGRAFFAIGIGPGVLGLILFFWRDRRLAMMLVLMFLANAGFYINYRVMDKETMFLPTYLIWAVWLGLGLQALLDWMGAVDSLRLRRLGQALLPALIAGSILAALSSNWRLADLSDDWSARQRGEAILRHIEPEGLFFGWWDSVPVIQYLQLVEGQRRDVQVINRFLIAPADMLVAVRKEVSRRPVYIDSLPDQFSSLFRVEVAGPVVRLKLLLPQACPRNGETARSRR